MLVSLRNYSQPVFLSGIFLMAASLPLSMFGMSVAQFLIVGAWLLSGNLPNKIKAAFSNPIVWMFALLYLWHVAGLIYTDDWKFGMKELRVKLPLIILPLVFSSMPALSSRQFRQVFMVFIAATFLSTLVSTGIYLQWIPIAYNDVRDISVFISHIRLSLLICVAIVVSIFFFKAANTALKLGYGVVIVWFVFFLSLLESLTGLGILVVLSLIFVLVLIQKHFYGFYKWSLTLMVFLLVCGVVYQLSSWWHEVTYVNKAEFTNLPAFTDKGNRYWHDTLSLESENGHPVWINICEDEMREEWNKKSNLPYDGLNLKGDEIKGTIIRYLSSKGLRKDGDAILHLNSDDIKAIEKGATNVSQIQSWNFINRIKTTMWEVNRYRQHHQPNGHSLTMRFEFWKTACKIIQDHPWIGVGTGDAPQAFAQKYDETQSPLLSQYRLRSHNQYLAVAVALGIPAMIFFMVTLVLPLCYKSNRYSLYLAFWCIACMSMLSEDTLETQAGVSFFVFLNSFFLFLKPNALAK